jgi:hypothetical protein
MNAKYKKSLKLVTLLITAIIIATVSAETLRYMYIEGGVTVSSAKLIWHEGSDVTNCNITGSTATLAVNVEQGTPVNFTEALFMQNTNTSGSFSYTISVTQALSSSDFERANLYVYENYTSPGDWTYLDTLDLTDDTDTVSNSLAADNYLRMTLELNATVASGTSTFAVQVEYS